MSSEPQFLSFKGLKQYTPDEGWGQVSSVLQPSQPSQTSAPVQALRPDGARKPDVARNAVPDNVPTLTEEPELEIKAAAASIMDPLISELFEQLRVPPSDELTQTWRTIAAEMNLLTQRMSLHRELQERLQKLEQDMHDLRHTILQHLQEVQSAADQQLASARLRAEVSALAQSKLAAKLSDQP